ncbi:DUF1697 domain-containing protein [Thermoactinospora rubra]|uniref:DUF1697 domain-containing protein n=1 Tax=Thermoactinospora rubra TaxID=1088767 RepID=UPI000A0FCCB7|nr:DUF1697 domain-containing protein [Thermoactinospora rubra]
MERYAALLRGINLGSRMRMSMADLRDLLAGLGYTDVATHLQSGNAVFTGTGGEQEVAARIEAAIRERLGMPVRCLVRGRRELADVVARDPLREAVTDPARYLVTFLSDKPDPGRYADLDPARFAPETYVVGEREIYVWHPDGMRNSKLTHAFWEKRLGLVATSRNWNTVTKLLSMLD